jgi:hypothetical protein
LVNAQTKKIAELEAACVNLRLEKENLTVGYWELSEKHKALVEFVPLFYMHYLFLLRRLKCGAPKLKELGTVAQQLRWLFGHHRQKRKDKVLGLC